MNSEQLGENPMVALCRALGVHGRQIAILSLRMQGRTPPEIAELVGVDRATVYRQLNAVRARVVQAGESLAIAERAAGRERVRAARDLLHLLCGDVCEQTTEPVCEAHERRRPQDWGERPAGVTEARYAGEASARLVQWWRRATTGPSPPPRLTDDHGRPALPAATVVRAEDVLTYTRGYE